MSFLTQAKAPRTKTVRENKEHVFNCEIVKDGAVGDVYFDSDGDLVIPKAILEQGFEKKVFAGENKTKEYKVFINAPAGSVTNEDGTIVYESFRFSGSTYLKVA